MSFIIEEKKVTILCDSDKEGLPVVYLNSYEDEVAGIMEECRKLGCRDIVLVQISGISWNDDLTPWPADPLYRKGEPFGGKADEYLKTLKEKIVPEAERYIRENLKKQISCRIIAGYSLAGLFALYSIFNSSLFDMALSASGSLWYPSFRDYVFSHEIDQKVARIYLSLGDREAAAKHPVLADVGRQTAAIRDHLKGYADVFYEENEGNHFHEPLTRLAKGIRHLTE